MNKSGEETILSLPERHNRILALLQQNGSISVVQLAELFKVSEVTIRKDLSFLEQQKKLYRTHGSAILISPYISDRHVNEKEKKNVAEKRAIGAKAASLVAQDDSIIIASGTTMAFLAREIKPVGHLTVITAAVPVTSILSQDTNVDVIQLGGITRSSSVSVVGPFAEQMLGNFNCSKLFVGVDGIDLEFGLTTTNMLEAALNRVMMNAAQKVIVLADSSKFGRRGFSKICDLEAVDRIITDSGGVVPSVADGSCYVGVTLEENARKAIADGLDVAIVYPAEGTSVLPDGAAIVRGCAHEENARQFIDFLLSPDVQQLLGAELSRRSVRTDTASDALPELTVLPYDLRRADERRQELFDAWQALCGEVEA